MCSRHVGVGGCGRHCVVVRGVGGGVGVCEGLFWGGVFGVVFADVPRTCHSTARPSRAFAHTQVTVTPKAAVDAEQLKSAVKEAISKAGFQVE